MKITDGKACAFWQKVDKNGPLPDQSKPHYAGLNQCWNWTGQTNHNGYGRLSVSADGKRLMVRTHRFSWVLQNGQIHEGSLVLHKCDNPSCVNPDHLFLGSHQDNQRDCSSKERRNPHSGPRAKYKPRTSITPRVLTQKQVDEIRTIRQKSQVSCAEIAKNYGVSRAMIWLIVSGKSWKLSAPLPF